MVRVLRRGILRGLSTHEKPRPRREGDEHEANVKDCEGVEKETSEAERKTRKRERGRVLDGSPVAVSPAPSLQARVSQLPSPAHPRGAGRGEQPGARVEGRRRTGTHQEPGKRRTRHGRREEWVEDKEKEQRREGERTPPELQSTAVAPPR